MLNSSSSPKLFVVGIAASAGGLPAMTELLRHASCHKSMCFVVVSHVSRFSKNDLAVILSKASNLESVVIEDGMQVQHCKLYIIPPNKYVRIERQCLKLSPRPVGEANRSADYFMESLAEHYGSNAIGVVLSGARVGFDGAQGVQAIKAAGGHTYAQDPSTALFPDMPLAAVNTGCVDSVLPPAFIGEELSIVSWAESAANAIT